MNPTQALPGEALAQLRDLHLPEAVGWWPPAPGWWGLAILVLLMTAYGGYRWHRFRVANRYRTAAREAVRAALRRYQRDGDSRAYLQTVNQVLRRAALVAFPRAEVAGLTGGAWLEFLHRSGGESVQATEPGRCLAEGAYRAEFECDAEAVCRLALHWIERHSLQHWQRSASASREAAGC